MKTMKMTRRANMKRHFLELAVLSAAITSHATTYTWDGGGASNKLSTAANWAGDAIAFGDHNYVFGDGSLQSSLNNDAVQTMGQLQFTGDAFTFSGSSINNENPDAHARAGMVMNTASTITFNNLVTLRRGITGTGTGVLVLNDIGFVSRNNAWDSAATVVINDADPGTGNGPNRTLTFAGTQKVIVNSGTANGLSRSKVKVQSGAVLGGAGFITPGITTDDNIANVTVESGGRLSPGDNYHTGADVGTLTFAFIANSSGIYGRLILNTGALFTFDLAAPGASDKIAVTAGGVTLNSQQFTDFTFNVLPGFTAGTYTLIDSVATTGSLGAVTTGMIGDSKAILMIVDNDLVLEVRPGGTVVIIR